ncbi:hypothetical protein [Clostridium tetani]|uniref:hypothetical protein n=1 Tax=Clostridium tetani TaxID=1513 RepID=UPI001024D0B7|nr:hypothetical protein [Clostridium tetani]RXI72142.1 hypothetical protein DP127_07725 [Clostridium tetani]BDR75281.1 hypothetical protein K154306013_09410 [Clostridium tetani]
MTKEIYIVHYYNIDGCSEDGTCTVKEITAEIETKEELEDALKIINTNYGHLGKVEVEKGVRPLTEKELKEVAFQNVGKELANLKLEAMEKDNAITKLGEELSNEKLQRMTDNSTNLKLEDEIEKLRKEIQNFNRGE